MSTTETKEVKKGRLAWLIPVLEIIVIVAYFAIGFGGIKDAFAHMDFEGMFKSVETAITFLLVATIILAILCFVPIFKSKGNIRWAIWDIIWVVLTIYGLAS